MNGSGFATSGNFNGGTAAIGEHVNGIGFSSGNQVNAGGGNLNCGTYTTGGVNGAGFPPGA